METVVTNNKAVIRFFYDEVLNKRSFDAIDSVVSKDFADTKGGSGPEAFRKGVIALTNIFPDGQWTPAEMVSEGNKVMVVQNLTGTHGGQFLHIPATGKKITGYGMVLYELREGKIVRFSVLTNTLEFLQQLGAIPADLSTLQPVDKTAVYLVDRFTIPPAAMEAFQQRLKYNRDLIKQMPGFIKDDIMTRKTDNGMVELLTVAVWKDQTSLGNAKKLVQAEYDKINFNPAEFTKSLNILMERDIYQQH